MSRKKAYGLWRVGFALLLVMSIGGCSDAEEASAELEPVAFHSGDTCHVCGMVIGEFPGPKGQAISTGRPLKFCSVAEMIGWWLQPENQKRHLRLYVHDMARTDWNAPEDAHLIDAREAWYVAGTGRRGAMGAVLASYADEDAARKLAEQEGGQVLRFDEINQAWLLRASGSGLKPGAAAGSHHARHEQTTGAEASDGN